MADIVLTGRLAGIALELDDTTYAALMEHLESGTSAEWLAETLSGAGYPVSASTIRTQRRSWQATGRYRKAMEENCE